MKQLSYAGIVAATLLGASLLMSPNAQAQGVCVDAVTAGGWVEEGTDAFANFGLNAREETQGEVTTLTGELNFVDADLDCHVVGHEVISYTVLDDFCREIVYDVILTLDDVPVEGSFIATVVVCDYGEGVNEPLDFFSIEVTNEETGEIVETCSASGDVIGGNVQLHVYGNCP